MRYFSLIKRRSFGSDSEPDPMDYEDDLSLDSFENDGRYFDESDDSSKEDYFFPYSKLVAEGQGENSRKSSSGENKEAAVPQSDSVATAGANKPVSVATAGADKPVSVKKIKVKKQRPDWDAIFFTSSEKYCDEILTRPELDTYFEDCKLAEDAALNFVAKFDMPVFGSLRDFNQAQINRALKNIKQSFHTKEELLALVTMFDFLSCCCQSGNLLNLYKNCKDDLKRRHLNNVDSTICSALDRLTSNRVSLNQLQSVERILTSSINRIPSSLHLTYFSSKPAIKRKIAMFEMEEKSKRENSVYHFNDDKPTSPARLKSKSPIVTATLNNWLELDYEELLQTPSKSDTSLGGRFSSTPKSTQSMSSPAFKSNKTSSSKKTKSDDCPIGAKWLFFDGKEESCSPTDKSDKQIQKKLKILSSREKTSARSSKPFSAFMSNSEETKRADIQVKSRSVKSPGSKIVYYSDSSDDSLPDMPIVLKKEPTSTLLNPRKPETDLSEPSHGKQTSQHPKSYPDNPQFRLQLARSMSFTKIQTQKSPYKMKLNTWRKKCESPASGDSDPTNRKLLNQQCSAGKFSPSVPQETSLVSRPKSSSTLTPKKLTNSLKLNKPCKCGKCQKKLLLRKKVNF